MPIRIVLRDTIARMAFVNSDDCPSYVVEDGVRRHWVGIGWVEDREAPKKGDYHIADDPHAAVAALMLDKEPRLVTTKERTSAKKRLFEYQYGKKDEALSLALGRLHPRDADGFKPLRAEPRAPRAKKH